MAIEKNSQMRKLITVNDCENCPFVWYYLGLDGKCSLENKKDIPTDIDSVPEWCPLPAASKEIIEAEKILTLSRGLDYDYEETGI